MPDYVIISIEKLPERALAQLKEWEVRNAQYTEQDLARAQVLIGWQENVTEELIRKMGSLRVIQTLSAGVDGMPFQLLRNVRVFSNAAGLANPVAEHAWALILGLAKNVNKKERRESYQIYGKVLLVVGCGGIGSRIAEIGKRAFGMKIIGVSRSFYRPEFFDDRFGINETGSLLHLADVVVLTLPLSNLTKGFLTYDKLSRAKQSSIIVNVGRGDVIRKEDIYRLLVERPRTRFGTDVFWNENGLENFDSKLWELQNFMGTPHQGGAVETSPEVLEGAIVAATRNIRDYMTTGSAKNEVKARDYL